MALLTTVSTATTSRTHHAADAAAQPCVSRSHRPTRGHSFVYSLYPHEGGWREADVVQAGYELNVPLTVVATGAHEGALPPAQSWVTVSGEGVVVEALKRSQDGQGLILRVYESKGIRGTGKVDLCFDARQVHETNLMEAVEASVALTGRSFAAPIAPFEIKTFLICTQP